MLPSKAIDPHASMRSDIELIRRDDLIAVVDTVAGFVRGKVTAVHPSGFNIEGIIAIEWRAVRFITSEPAPWRKCLGESWTEVRLSDEHNRTAIRLEFHAKSAPMSAGTAREMADALMAFAEHLDPDHLDDRDA